MLGWLEEFAKNRELCAPFLIKNDADYYGDLRKRLALLNKWLEAVSADDESRKIASKYGNKICEAIRDYYKGNIGTCHQKIENLIKGCSEHMLAVSDLYHSRAIPGDQNKEIQLFRARCLSDAKTLALKDMLHLPFSRRGKSGNYRFSIPGVTSLYLANTSYGCWIEMGKPSEHDFYVSPVVLDGTQRVLNLAVRSTDIRALNDGKPDFVHCWLKLLILMIATSYKVEEENRTFRSEYIVSQSIMLACKRLGLNGIVYFSKRVEADSFAYAAINLALFADYNRHREYGEICEHLKIDQPMNYQLFRQLSQSAIYQKYELRLATSPYITNIGDFNRQYGYRETMFYRFDEHLFARWKDKDTITWGNAIKTQLISESKDVVSIGVREKGNAQAMEA